MNKKLVSILFSGAMLLQALPALAEIKEVTIFNTNDIESVYDPVDAFWNPDITHIGGIPYLATLIHQERAKVDTSFLFDAGDIFTGSLSKKTHGKLSFDLYGAMGYDAIALGNHEFEYGWKVLKETMPRAQFPVLNSNIKFAEGNAPFARPYAIIERNGVRVGVVGVMGEDAFYNTMLKKNREGLTVDDPTETVQYWVDKIKDEVDLVVVLTHQNRTAPMQTDKEADPEVQRGFDEDYAMAGQLKDVDLILGGHSDNGLWEPVVHPDTGTVISLTFGQGKYLGYSKFKVDTDTNEATYLNGKLIPVESDKLKRDEKTGKLIDDVRARFPELSKQIAVMDQGVYRRYYRESTIGNFMSDLMREEAGADIAMMSSGSIRIDLNKGPVTVENILDLYPFVGKLTVVELTGAQIKELLEYSYTLPYGLAQFSGIKTTYDSTKPEGQRLLSLMINGKPVNDDQKYSVATYSYAATGGDGYTVFEKGKQLSQGKAISQVLIDKLTEKKHLTAPSLGRQVDVSINKK